MQLNKELLQEKFFRNAVSLVRGKWIQPAQSVIELGVCLYVTNKVIE